MARLASSRSPDGGLGPLAPPIPGRRAMAGSAASPRGRGRGLEALRFEVVGTAEASCKSRRGCTPVRILALCRARSSNFRRYLTNPSLIRLSAGEMSVILARSGSDRPAAVRMPVPGPSNPCRHGAARTAVERPGREGGDEPVERHGAPTPELRQRRSCRCRRADGPGHRPEHRGGLCRGPAVHPGRRRPGLPGGRPRLRRLALGHPVPAQSGSAADRRRHRGSGRGPGGGRVPEHRQAVRA